MDGSHGRDAGTAGGARTVLPFIIESPLVGGFGRARGWIDVVVEFLLSLSGPWRALRAKMGTSSLRSRLRGCDAAEVADITLAVRFKLFSGAGPFSNFGVVLFVAISVAGLDSTGRDGGR